MSFLSSLWDVVKGAAPTVAGTVAGAASGNPIIGGVVAKAIRGLIGGDAKDDSPISEIEAETIFKNPEAVLGLKKIMADMEIARLREQTRQMGIVNQTMQVEAKSEAWPQSTWRPFNGFLFGITLFFDYVVSQIISQVIIATVKSISEIAWVHIPIPVYLLWASVLGVGVASRGLEKVTKTKASGNSIVSGGLGQIKNLLS